LSGVRFSILLFGCIGSCTVGADTPRPRAIVWGVTVLLITVLAAGLLAPLVTNWTRSQSTDIRILVSILLLAPPAFCMGMMFPLGLNIWRRHEGLLPFFWSTNGVTSMLASVLARALLMPLGM